MTFGPEKFGFGQHVPAEKKEDPNLSELQRTAAGLQSMTDKLLVRHDVLETANDEADMNDGEVPSWVNRPQSVAP